MMTFNNDKLREEIFQARLTQAEVARRMGVTRSMVGQYVNGNREPGVPVLVQFLRATGYTDERLKRQRLIDWYIME